MDDNIYSIKVILIYKTSEKEKRDYTLIDSNKNINYDLTKILNKNIYDIIYNENKKFDTINNNHIFNNNIQEKIDKLKKKQLTIQYSDMFINIKNLEKIKLDSNDEKQYNNFTSSIKIITKTNIDELQKNIKNDANMVKDDSLNYILEYKNIKDYNFINYYKSYINSIIFYELPIIETHIYTKIFSYDEKTKKLFFNRNKDELKKELEKRDIYNNIEKIDKSKEDIDVLNNLIYDLYYNKYKESISLPYGLNFIADAFDKFKELSEKNNTSLHEFIYKHSDEEYSEYFLTYNNKDKKLFKSEQKLEYNKKISKILNKTILNTKNYPAYEILKLLTNTKSKLRDRKIIYSAVDEKGFKDIIGHEEPTSAQIDTFRKAAGFDPLTGGNDGEPSTPIRNLNTQFHGASHGINTPRFTVNSIKLLDNSIKISINKQDIILSVIEKCCDKYLDLNYILNFFNISEEKTVKDVEKEDKILIITNFVFNKLLSHVNGELVNMREKNIYSFYIYFILDYILYLVEDKNIEEFIKNDKTKNESYVLYEKNLLEKFTFLSFSNNSENVKLGEKDLSIYINFQNCNDVIKQIYEKFDENILNILNYNHIENLFNFYIKLNDDENNNYGSIIEKNNFNALLEEIVGIYKKIQLSDIKIPDEHLYELFLIDKNVQINKEKLNKIFIKMEEDFKLHEKYNSTKQLYNDRVQRNVSEDTIPKNYQNPEERQNILIEYAKYFNVNFDNMNNNNDKIKILETNKDLMNSIITYYNIYELLKYIYLPNGTILNDNFFNKNTNKEMKSYFYINNINPIIQKSDTVIDNNVVKVYYEIDYEIKSFHSNIEFFINFNNLDESDLIDKGESSDFVEKKCSKDLYDIYDAKIFDRKNNSNKIFFDKNLNYERIISDFKNIKKNNKIFDEYSSQVESVEDTFMIKEFIEFYNSKEQYIIQGDKEEKIEDENINKILKDWFINYFFFRENNNLMINQKIYNIQNVEIINPYDAENDNICKTKEIDDSHKDLIFLKKKSKDFRLRYLSLEVVYRIYLYVNYFTKKSKDEKIPIDKIIRSKSNCINKAKILDKDLKRLFKDYYKENYFLDKLLKMQKGRKEEKEIEEMQNLIKNNDDEKDLKKFTEKIDKSDSDNYEKKAKTIGGKIKNKKKKKSYKKNKKITKRSVKLIKYYLKYL
jgi:hypothetical protein